MTSRPLARLAAAVYLLLASTAFATETGVSDVPGLLRAVAGASEGDVIRLAGGSYVLTQPLQISAGVTLQGAGRGETILAAADGWTAPLDKRPDNEIDFRTADRNAYLIDLGDDHTGVTIRDLTLTAPTLHGGIYGHASHDLILTGLEVRGFAWSGVRLFGTRGARIHDNTFIDAADRVAKTTGGAMFLTYHSESEIFNNRIWKTETGRRVFGIKGRQLTNTRIHHNTIGVNFAIELPFENDYGIEIDHNYLGGVVSIPKHGGGLREIEGEPIQAGQAFHIHHNIFTTSYAIEGPRNGLEVDHNLFTCDADDDGGNLISIFGSDSRKVIPGPLAFHDNYVQNPGRGLFWSDLPHDRISFMNNRITLDETTPPEHPDGLFGFRVKKGEAATDFSTIEVVGNTITITGTPRSLFRNQESGEAVIRDNTFENVKDAASYENPATEDVEEVEEPLRFDAGVDGEFHANGFGITIED